MADGAIPQELKTQLDGFGKTLNDIREEQKRIDAEVKKKGDADPLLKASLERLEKSHDKIRDDINQLHRKSARPVVSQVTDAKTAALETKANLEFARWQGNDGDAAKGAQARPIYAKTFGKMLRLTEKALSPEEVKALSVGSSPDGGYFVDPFRAQTMIDKLYETSNMRALCSSITISSSSYEEPIDRDEASTGWVGEQSTRSETNTPQVGKLVIPVHEHYALVKSTQNLLDDAGIDVEAWLDQKVIDEMTRQENTTFVTGNGTNKPRGFTSYTTAATADASRAFGQLEHVSTGANGAFKTASATVSPADDLIDLIYKFKPGYRSNLRWGGTRLTLGAIRKFKDQQGNYIYDARLGASGIIDFVLGYPWDEIPDMAAYTTPSALGVVLADWRRGYLIIDRSGIRQLRDPFTSKGYVLFYTFKRVGGGVRDSDAIKFVKFAA